MAYLYPMHGETKDVLRQKIVDGISAPVPRMTRRDIRLPAVPGKAMAVIGMRRAGKTFFLWQCLADRLAAGMPREALLFFNFEDERLADLQARDLQWLMAYPGLRRRKLRGNLGA